MSNMIMQMRSRSSKLNNRNRKLRAYRTAAVMCALFTIIGLNSFAQQDQTRGLHVKKIEESRPASTTTADPKQPRTYRSTTSSPSSSEIRKSASASDAIIGVTVWRLRPVRSTDNLGARILEHQVTRNTEWAAERIETDARLNEGDRVRVSIESPSTGYVYVIDREQNDVGWPIFSQPPATVRNDERA